MKNVENVGGMNVRERDRESEAAFQPSLNSMAVPLTRWSELL